MKFKVFSFIVLMSMVGSLPVHAKNTSEKGGLSGNSSSNQTSNQFKKSSKASGVNPKQAAVVKVAQDAQENKGGVVESVKRAFAKAMHALSRVMDKISEAFQKTSDSLNGEKEVQKK